MPTFVAFLRAVNVGKRKYPMAELRTALADAGFEDVETHIQTGNVRFRTRLRSQDRVVAGLEEAMLADRGFAVPVVLMTPTELTETFAEAQRFRTEYAGPVVRVGRRAVHLLLAKPYHEVSAGNAVLERRLGVATTRSLTVMTKLTEKWGT